VGVGGCWWVLVGVGVGVGGCWWVLVGVGFWVCVLSYWKVLMGEVSI